MYGVASEISNRAAFFVPTLLPIPPQVYIYARKKHTLTQPKDDIIRRDNLPLVITFNIFFSELLAFLEQLTVSLLKRSAIYYRIFTIFFFHSFSLLVCVFMLIANLTATLLFKKEKYYLKNEKSPRSFEASNENKNHNSSVTRNWVITDKLEVDGTLILLSPTPFVSQCSAVLRVFKATDKAIQKGEKLKEGCDVTGNRTLDYAHRRPNNCATLLLMWGDTIKQLPVVIK